MLTKAEPLAFTFDSTDKRAASPVRATGEVFRAAEGLVVGEAELLPTIVASVVLFARGMISP